MFFDLAFNWLEILIGESPAMPKRKYIVTPGAAEREQLQQLLRSGKHLTRKITRARILLKAAEGCTDEQIAASLGVGRARLTLRSL